MLFIHKKPVTMTEERGRKLLQDIHLTRDDYIYIRVDQAVLDCWKIPSEYKNTGWILFRILEPIRRQQVQGIEEAIVSIECISYLVGQDRRLLAQAYLRIGDAWEIQGEASRQDIDCRQRQTDPDHPHNEVDMPRLKVQEMFQEEKTAELFQMEERIKAKRLGLSLGNLSQISESPHLPLDASDEGGSLHKAYRRTACELINHRGPLHPLLMKFVKKEENTLFRIFQFKSWLQEISNKTVRRILLQSYNEINADLLILFRIWEALMQLRNMGIIFEKKMNPVIQLATWFQELVDTHNEGISDLEYGEMLPEALDIFDAVSMDNDLEYDNNTITTELVGSPSKEVGDRMGMQDYLGGIITEDLESGTGNLLFHKGQLVQILEGDEKTLRVRSLDILEEEAIVSSDYVNTDQDDFLRADERSRRAQSETSTVEAKGWTDYKGTSTPISYTMAPERGKIMIHQDHDYEEIDFKDNMPQGKKDYKEEDKENIFLEKRPPLVELTQMERLRTAEKKMENFQSMVEILQSLVEKQGKESSELRKALELSQQRERERIAGSQPELESRLHKEVSRREVMETDLELLKRSLDRESEESERRRNQEMKERAEMEGKLREERERVKLLEDKLSSMRGLVQEAERERRRQTEHGKKTTMFVEEKRKELGEVNVRMQELERSRQRSRDREKELEHEMVMRDRTISEQKKRIEGLMDNRGTGSMEHRDHAMERRDQLRVEEEGIELTCYLSDLKQRIDKFKNDVVIQYDIAVRDDVQPSTEGSKMVERISKRAEELHREYIGLRARVNKLALHSRHAAEGQDNVANEIKMSLDEAECTLETLKDRTMKNVSNTTGDIQAFKLASIHNLVLDKLVPGSTFHEWLRMARNLQKKHNIEDSIMLMKVYDSMKANCHSLMVHLKSKNPKSINIIESLLYPTYGLPITFLEMASAYHEKHGQIPSPLNPSNAAAIKSTAEAHVMGINAAVCQLDYHIEKFGKVEGLRQMEQGILSSTSLYKLAGKLPVYILEESVVAMGTMDTLEKLNFLKARFERTLSASQAFLSVYGVHGGGEMVEEKKAPKPKEDFRSRRRVRVLLQDQRASQARPNRANGASRKSQATFPTEIGNIDLFNSCLAAQFNRASTGNYTPMVIQTSPGHLSFSNSLQQEVLAYTNQDKARASALMNLMGTKDGCGVCLTILKEQKNQSNKTLLPHFRMGKSNKLHDKALTASCPMLLRLTESKAHDILLKQENNCQKCGWILSSNTCSNRNCRRFGCNDCRKAITACTCSQAIKDIKQRFISNYEGMLTKHKANISSISPAASQSVFIAAFIHETIWEEEEENEGVYSLATNDTRNLPRIYGTREQLLEEYENVQIRRTGRQLFTILHLEGLNGKLETFIHDSGCSECCIASSLIGTNIPAADKKSRSVETAGGNIISQNSFRALIPLAKNEKHDFVEVEGVSMDKILSPLPVVNLEEKVAKLYSNYLKHCSRTNKEPEVTENQLPKETGGKISGLIGNRVCTLKELFTCPETGLSIHKSPLRGKNGEAAVAVSGLISEGNENEEQSLATEVRENILVLAMNEDEEQDEEEPQGFKNINPDEVFVREQGTDREEKLEEVVDSRNNLTDESLTVPTASTKDLDDAWKRTSSDRGGEKRRRKIEALIEKQERKIWDRFMTTNNTGNKGSINPMVKDEEKRSEEHFMDTLLSNLSEEEIQLNYGDIDEEERSLSEEHFPKLGLCEGMKTMKSKTNPGEGNEQNFCEMDDRDNLEEGLRENGIIVRNGKKQRKIKSKKSKVSTVESFLREQTEPSEKPENITCLCGRTHSFITENDCYKIIEPPQTPLCVISLPSGHEAITDFMNAKTIENIRELFGQEKITKFTKIVGNTEIKTNSNEITRFTGNKCNSTPPITQDKPQDKEEAIIMDTVDKDKRGDGESEDMHEDNEYIEGCAHSDLSIIKIESVRTPLADSWTQREFDQLTEEEKTFVDETYQSLRSMEIAGETDVCLDMDVIENIKQHCATADTLQSYIQDKITENVGEIEEEDVEEPQIRDELSINECNEKVLKYFTNHPTEEDIIIKAFRHETLELESDKILSHHLEVILYHRGRRDWRLVGILESLCDANTFTNGNGTENSEQICLFDGSLKMYLERGTKYKSHYFVEGTIGNYKLEDGINRQHINIRILVDKDLSNINLNCAVKTACKQIMQENRFGEEARIMILPSAQLIAEEDLRHLYPKIKRGHKEMSGFLLATRQNMSFIPASRANYVISAKLCGGIREEVLRIRQQFVENDDNLMRLMREETHITLGVFHHDNTSQFSLDMILADLAKEIRTTNFQVIPATSKNSVHWDKNIVALLIYSPRMRSLNKRLQMVCQNYELWYEPFYTPHCTLVSDTGGAPLHPTTLQQMLQVKTNEKQELISRFYLYKLKDFKKDKYCRVLNLSALPCVWQDVDLYKRKYQLDLQEIHQMVLNNHFRPVHYPTQHLGMLMYERARSAVAMLINKGLVSSVNFNTLLMDTHELIQRADFHLSLAARIARNRKLHMDEEDTDSEEEEDMDENTEEEEMDENREDKKDENRVEMMEEDPVRDEAGVEQEHKANVDPLKNLYEEISEDELDFEEEVCTPGDLHCIICNKIARNAVTLCCCQATCCRGCAVKGLLQTAPLCCVLGCGKENPAWFYPNMAIREQVEKTNKVSNIAFENMQPSTILNMDLKRDLETNRTNTPTLTEGTNKTDAILPNELDFTGSLTHTSGIYDTTSIEDTFKYLRGAYKPTSVLTTEKVASWISDLHVMLTLDLDNEKFEGLIKGLLAPEFCPYMRCRECSACGECAPTTLFKIADLRKARKIQQNADIFKAVAPLELSDGTFKIIARYPVQEDLVKKYLSGTNITTVTQEYDRKIKHLSKEQRIMAVDEFAKLVWWGIIVPFSSLPGDIQRTIDSNEVQYYLSAAPSYKLSSKSTVCRIAVNGSKKNKHGHSINDLMSTGKFDMDLHSSFRAFRLHNFPIINDLEKFFNSIFLSVHSFNISQMVWRENCDPEKKLERFIITRLTYGLRASTSICQAALIYICEFADKQCTGCKNGEKNCGKINHVFSAMVRKIYVDDIAYSCPTKEMAGELMEFAGKLLKQFGFSTKSWVYQSDGALPDTERMVDELQRANVLGYFWNYRDDKIRCRTPIIHNGSKFRNFLVKNRTANFIDESGVTKKLTPPELVVLDTDKDAHISYDEIFKIYRELPHTIRFLTSKTSAIYDPTGMIGPLVGQLRFALSSIVAKRGLIYDKEVAREDYLFWLRAYYEAIKGTKIEFHRQLQYRNHIPGTKIYGVLVVDYSDVANIAFYIVYQTPGGNHSALFMSRSLLLKVSIPRGELSAISMAAAARKIFMEELAGFVSNISIFSDSKVALFWSNKSPEHLDGFNGNRVRGIQACLDPTADLWHVVGPCNSADTGSKFASVDNFKRPFLTTADIQPGSLFHSPRWILDLDDATKKGLITPMSKILSDTNCNLLADHEQNMFIEGLRGHKQSYLQKGLQEHLILPDASVKSGKIFESCEATMMVTWDDGMSCRGANTPACLFNRSQDLFRSYMMLTPEENSSFSSQEQVAVSIQNEDEVDETLIDWTDAYELDEEISKVEEIMNDDKDPIKIMATNIELEHQHDIEARTIQGKLGRQMANKFYLRYKGQISNEHFGLTNLQHILPFEEFMTRDYGTLVIKHRMVLLACIKFLNLIKKTLRIEEAHLPLIDSVTMETSSLIGYARDLPSHQEQKGSYYKVIKDTVFLKGQNKLSSVKTIPGYVFQVGKEQLHTLARPRRENINQAGLSFKQRYKLHPGSTTVVHGMSQIRSLLQRACTSKDGNERSNGILKAWPIIVHLVNLVTYRYKSISFFSDLVLQDIVTLVQEAIQCGCRGEFKIAEIRYRNHLGNTLRQLKKEYTAQRPDEEYRANLEKAYREREQYNQEDRMLTEKGYLLLLKDLSASRDKLRELMRVENLIAHPIDLFVLSCGKISTTKIHRLPFTRDCIDNSDYPRAERAANVFLSMVASSEVLQNASEARIKNHVIMIGGFALSKSRFTDYMMEGVENLSTMLLRSAGYSQGSLVLDTFSTLALPLFRLHHTKREGSLKRRRIDVTHHGRYRTVMSISKTKHLLGVQSLVAALIKNCTSCDRRLKKFEKVPEGRIHSQGLLTNAINLVLFVDLAGPLIIQGRAGMETRNASREKQKFYVIVAVCSTSRLVTMAMIGSRKTNDVALGLRAIMARTNFPYMMVSDNEGALHTIAREGTIGIVDGNYITTFGIPIYFVPPTERGHISNAVCERRIRSLKSVIGTLDFSKTGLDAAGAGNVLMTVEEMLNSVPVGTRGFGKRHDITSKSPNSMFISPNNFLGKLNTRRPIGLIKLERGIDNTLYQAQEISTTISKMMAEYLISLQREAIRGFDLNPGTVEAGDVCAFKINESQFHQALSPWRYGIVTEVHTSQVDGRARIITLRYTTLPGDIVNKSYQKPRHVKTRRRLDQVVKLSSGSCDHLAHQFSFDAEFTEKLINRQFGGDLQEEGLVQLQRGETGDLGDQTNNKEETKEAEPKTRKRIKERWILKKPNQAVSALCECCSSANMNCLLASVLISGVAECTKILPKLLVQLLYLMVTISTVSLGNKSWGCDQFLLVSQKPSPVYDGLYEPRYPQVIFREDGQLTWGTMNNTSAELNRKFGSVYVQVGKIPEKKVESPSAGSTFIFIPRERMKDALFYSSESDTKNSPFRIKWKDWRKNNGKEKIFCTNSKQNLFVDEPSSAYISSTWPGGRHEEDQGDEEDYEDYKTGAGPTYPTSNIKTDYHIEYFDSQESVNNTSALMQADESRLPGSEREQGSTRMTVNEGDLTSIRCLEDTSNIDLIVWKRYVEGNTYMTLRSTQNTLIIGKASPQDEALYKCLAKTNLGELITVSTYLYVRRTSVYTEGTFKDETDEDGDKLFEAYNCDDSKRNNLISLDLRAGIGCNKAVYKNYYDPQTVQLMILQEKESHTFEALHCSLEIWTRHAYCGSGLFDMEKYSHSNGFRVSNKQRIELNREQCSSAYFSGTIMIKIGDQQVHLPTKTKATGVYDINTYLSGSALYKNGSCKGANAIRVYWDKNSPLEEPKGQIVNLMGTLRVQLVTALSDSNMGEVLIPQYGLRFNSSRSSDPLYSSEQGIYLATSKDIFQKFVWVHKGRAKLLEPNTNELPALVIFDLPTASGGNMQRLAFSLGKPKSILGTDCQETQYRSYSVCQNSTNWKQFNWGGTDGLQDLSSGSVILLSNMIDETVAGLIEQICIIQDLLISRASRDFSKFGADLIYPERKGRGTISRALGEIGVIQVCDRKLVKATATRGTCCKNLQVRIVGLYEDTERIHYLEPLSRILVQNCEEVPCSKQLAVAHFNTRNTAMCQEKAALRACSWQMQRQKYDLKHLMFRPLQILDYGTRHISKEDIELIAGRVAGKANIGLDFLEKVVTNAYQCRGDPNCKLRQQLNHDISTEFVQLTNDDNVTRGLAGWQLALLATVVGWAMWCIIIGLFRFLWDFCRRIKAMTAGNSVSFCNIVVGIIVDLYSNLNPLQRKKEIKCLIRKLKNEVQSINDRMDEFQEMLLFVKRNSMTNNNRIRFLESNPDYLHPSSSHPMITPKVQGKPMLRPKLELRDSTASSKTDAPCAAGEGGYDYPRSLTTPPTRGAAGILEPLIHKQLGRQDLKQEVDEGEYISMN